MTSTDATLSALGELARQGAAASDERSLLDAAGGWLCVAGRARAVLACPDAGTLRLLAGSVPEPLLAASATAGAGLDRLADAIVPPPWAAAGVTTVAARRLGGLVIVAAWDAEPARVELDLGLDTVAAHLVRLAVTAELADLVDRVDNAQQLANMGDYDWNGVTDTNRWSDQLYRIYGYEPQEFNASFDRFLSLIHPEDRERIGGIIQEAYATGEPYQMIERIVRPDGTVRHLSSNGQAVRDSTGAPIRIRGTCIDITERVLSDQDRERSATRFRELADLSPDAVVVVGTDGRIAQANRQATELLGGDPVGHQAAALLPWPEAGGQNVAAVGVDGRPLQLDITTAELSPAGDERQHAAFLRDALPRLSSETLAATLREAHVRRRQALELNDNVVQGLTAAGLVGSAGDIDACLSYVERTLDSARRMMDEWLDPLGGDGLERGDLVRSTPSGLAAPRSDLPRAPAPQHGAGARRVLIVDDNEDLRTLARIQVESAGCAVVGEAGDGHEGVAMAAELQPEVVLLDLAMPRMDGLEALPLLLVAVPGVRVVIMSGFDQKGLAQQLLDTGASRYVEKGVRMDLGAVVQDVLADA
jgi:PAS domain S-box-containing protein